MKTANKQVKERKYFMNSMLLQEKRRKKWIKIREQTTLFDVSKNTIL